VLYSYNWIQWFLEIAEKNVKKIEKISAKLETNCFSYFQGRTTVQRNWKTFSSSSNETNYIKQPLMVRTWMCQEMNLKSI